MKSAQKPWPRTVRSIVPLPGPVESARHALSIAPALRLEARQKPGAPGRAEWGMIALLADIHANLEAFEACLAHARGHGATRFALLGDLVGYGADPGPVVERAAALAADGAIVVKGNHDEAVERAPTYLNDMAQAAIDWTRTVLTTAQKDFLAGLPLSGRDPARCYVHASADRP